MDELPIDPLSKAEIDGLFIEPRPDEDAWEAYLDFALERISGERSGGLTNRQIGELEALLGTMLPFEIGLLLVMGPPAHKPWRQWQDPETELAAWNAQVLGGICHEIEHGDFWFDGWGAPPASLDDRFEVARSEFETRVPALFPIYGNHAVPLAPADDQANSDGNPVLSVHRTDITIAGTDLAAWMHAAFDVPLPMWPADERHFTFWSDL